MFKNVFLLYREMSIFGDEELNRYGGDFLCELYRQANRLTERRIDRHQIFNAMNMGGITGDEGRHQAADESVQYLRRQNLIRPFENSNEVSLSDAGLDRARDACE